MSSAIIVSHDVDHISPYEHLNDLILPKFIVRALIERSKGYISSNELWKRLEEFLHNKWNSIDELADFDLQHNVSSTFFFAVNKGFGLSYESTQAKPYVDLIIQRGLKIGLHGIERSLFNRVFHERQEFKDLFGHECSGIRLHYLAPDYSTIELISRVGYLFDSSFRGDGSSFKIGECIHFPVHIMDTDVLTNGKRYQSVRSTKAVTATIKRLSELIDNQVDFISILFHDRYFSDAHASWRDWYKSIIEWINVQKIEIVNYDSAADRINSRAENETAQLVRSIS